MLSAGHHSEVVGVPEDQGVSRWSRLIDVRENKNGGHVIANASVLRLQTRGSPLLARLLSAPRLGTIRRLLVTKVDARETDSMEGLDQVRNALKACRNTETIGCIKLTQYRDHANAEGASHPVLFQIVPRANIVVIGSVPGAIEAGPGKAGYQEIARGQFSLGHKSGQGLGQIIARVGKLKSIDLPPGVTDFPSTPQVQSNHLQARQRLGLHVTNLVKCQAWTRWESKETATWIETAKACEERHLAREISLVDPSMVVLLGKHVAHYFSRAESWGLEGKKGTIASWLESAGFMTFHGKDRFVTAWAHTGGPYFWTEGRSYWDDYARQMARFVY